MHITQHTVFFFSLKSSQKLAEKCTHTLKFQTVIEARKSLAPMDSTTMPCNVHTLPLFTAFRVACKLRTLALTLPVLLAHFTL